MLPYWCDIKIISNILAFRYNENWGLESLVIKWSNGTTIHFKKLRVKDMHVPMTVPQVIWFTNHFQRIWDFQWFGNFVILLKTSTSCFLNTNSKFLKVACDMWTLTRTFLVYECKVCGYHLVLFRVLQLLPIKFTQWYISKSTMEHLQKLDWKSYLPLFSYGYRKCMFFDFLPRYIGPPKCVNCWV